MREIKFRVWNKIAKKMFDKQRVGKHGSLEFTNGLGFYHLLSDTLERSKNKTELMQYVGLNDKNGKEIYEGDIVKGETVELMLETDGMDDEEKEEYFNRKPNMKNSEVYWSNDDMGKWAFKPRMHLETVEVIGNIYENPELLE